MTSRYEESNGRWNNRHQGWGLFAWAATAFHGAGSSCARWAGALLFAVVLGAMPSSVLAETEGDYEYNVIDEKATITNYKGIIGDIVIPDKLGGYPVTKIGDQAFWGKPNMVRVVIPNSVTSIGYQAFGNCDNLANVVLGDGVTNIKGKAFESCSSLVGVVLPKAVTDIEADAFAYCSELTRVVIPASVNNIGDGAFAGCSKLTEIDVEPANQKYRSVQGILFNDNQKTLIQYPGGKDGEYQIPNTVTGIAKNAFGGCSKLTSVTIPDSVTDIGESAFGGCSNLTSMVIPGSVANIANSMFWSCSKLASVVISNGVTTIGEYAFYRCKSLTSIEIPNSVIDIGHSAFHRCTSLTSVVIPNRVKRFGNSTFSDCTSLASVTLGDSVEAIGISAFYGCTSLASIVIPNKVFSIGFNAFYGCSNLTSVVIPDSVFSIGSDAFSGCSSLTDLVIPDNVNDIGAGAFFGCSSLTSMVIPDKVHTIRKKTFSGCSNLTSVVISYMYESTIEKLAFEGCENLAGIYFAGRPAELKDPAEIENYPCTVYYVAGTPDWGEWYGGRPTAIWTIKVTFDGNGGIPTELEEQTYNAGVPCGELPTANHPDFPFAGWWMEDGKAQIDADTPAPLVVGRCTLYAAYSYEHSFAAGWNLISTKLNLIKKSQEELLNKGAMTLDANSQAYVSNANLAASQACWVYCHEAEDITLLGAPSEEDTDFATPLGPGWNFVGPLKDYDQLPPGAAAWHWNGRYFYPTANLRAGHGYYLYWPGN